MLLNEIRNAIGSKTVRRWRGQELCRAALATPWRASGASARIERAGGPACRLRLQLQVGVLARGRRCCFSLSLAWGSRASRSAPRAGRARGQPIAMAAMGRGGCSQGQDPARWFDSHDPEKEAAASIWDWRLSGIAADSERPTLVTIQFAKKVTGFCKPARIRHLPREEHRILRRQPLFLARLVGGTSTPREFRRSCFPRSGSAA